MVYEVMYFWRRVVRVVGRREGGKKAVDKATISSSGSRPRAGYSSARLKQLRYLLVALGRAPDIPARIL